MSSKLACALLAILATGCAAKSTAPKPERFTPQRHVTHAAELLTHHAGIRVVETIGGRKVFYRGALSEPLVVLDGMALIADPRGVLNEIDPRDVLEIKLLKDQADLTFYGFRGAHGVIVIRTKRHR